MEYYISSADGYVLRVDLYHHHNSYKLWTDYFLDALKLDEDSETEPHPIRKIPLLNACEGSLRERIEMMIGRCGATDKVTVTNYEERECIALYAQNTAYASGGNALRWALRLPWHRVARKYHRYDPIYVEGAHRAWLASILECVATASPFDQEKDMSKIIEFICNSTSEPLLISTNRDYPFQLNEREVRALDSTGNFFRRQRTSGKSMQDIFSELRRVSFSEHLEVTPENWETYRFGNGKDASHILALRV